MESGYPTVGSPLDGISRLEIGSLFTRRDLDPSNYFALRTAKRRRSDALTAPKGSSRSQWLRILFLPMEDLIQPPTWADRIQSGGVVRPNRSPDPYRFCSAS